MPLRVILVMAMVVMCGCGQLTTENGVSEQWKAVLIDISAASQIDGELFRYTTVGGYKWAIVNFSMTNLLPKENCLNWLEDSFEYSHNGFTYSQKLMYDGYVDIPDYLPKCYMPEQEQQGFVVFEVPLQEASYGVTVTFTTEEGPGGTWSL